MPPPLPYAGERCHTSNSTSRVLRRIVVTDLPSLIQRTPVTALSTSRFLFVRWRLVGVQGVSDLLQQVNRGAEHEFAILIACSILVHAAKRAVLSSPLRLRSARLLIARNPLYGKSRREILPVSKPFGLCPGVFGSFHVRIDQNFEWVEVQDHGDSKTEVVIEYACTKPVSADRTSGDSEGLRCCIVRLQSKFDLDRVEVFNSRLHDSPLFKPLVAVVL